MRTLVLLALVCGGCTVAGIERVQEDLELLKQRMAAREEVRIHVASAEPITKTSQRADPSEPHLTVAVPPCPPAAIGLLQHVGAKKKATGTTPRRARRSRK